MLTKKTEIHGWMLLCLKVISLLKKNQKVSEVRTSLKHSIAKTIIT